MASSLTSSHVYRKSCLNDHILTFIGLKWSQVSRLLPQNGHISPIHKYLEMSQLEISVRPLSLKSPRSRGFIHNKDTKVSEESSLDMRQIDQVASALHESFTHASIRDGPPKASHFRMRNPSKSHTFEGNSLQRMLRVLRLHF